MPNEKQIRALARQALEDGRLPRREPDGTWGGKAADVPCAICGERIRPDHLEYELQFGHDGAKRGVDVFISTFAASRRGRWSGRSSGGVATRRRPNEAWGFNTGSRRGLVAQDGVRGRSEPYPGPPLDTRQPA